MIKLIVLLLLYPMIGFTQTSLWTISKDGYVLYLGGTIHMLSKQDYPLPTEFNRAFQRSATVVFETNMEEAKTTAFGEQVTRLLTYPPGQSLKDNIKKQTYYQLQQFLATRNVPVEHFNQFKPGMVSLVLSVMELKRIGMDDIGVDQYFYNKAKQANKTTLYLETVEQQLTFLSNMGKGKENEIIISTIKDLSQLEKAIKTIKQAWRTGNESKMAKVTLSEMIRDYPEIYQQLLVTRNNNWMPQIKNMLKTKPRELVLVGALHLVGKQGLLQQLRQAGYQVELFK